MVEMTIRLTAAPGQAHRLVQALRVLMRDIQSQSGCSSAHIAADVDEAGAFWYQEDWQDEQALEWELKSDRFSQLLALMETSVTPPVLVFRTAVETRGLEYVASLRGPKDLP
jgi:quinol monooxygenase YgiN